MSGISHQNHFDVGVGIDVAGNVPRQADELLPKYDPIAREDHQKPHKSAGSGQHKREESKPVHQGTLTPGSDERTARSSRANTSTAKNQAVVAHDHAEVPRHCGH